MRSRTGSTVRWDIPPMSWIPDETNTHRVQFQKVGTERKVCERGLRCLFLRLEREVEVEVEVEVEATVPKGVWKVV